MANKEIGKINEGIILAPPKNNDDIRQNGFTQFSKRDSQSDPSTVRHSSCENTNVYCQFIVSHTKLAFSKFKYGIFVLN